MIYRDNLSKEIGYDLYKYKDKKGVEILLHTTNDKSMAYVDNEFMLCKQKEKYYVMGANPNINYHGYIVSKEEANKILSDSNMLEKIYTKYDMIAFG